MKKITLLLLMGSVMQASTPSSTILDQEKAFFKAYFNNEGLKYLWKIIDNDKDLHKKKLTTIAQECAAAFKRTNEQQYSSVIATLKEIELAERKQQYIKPLVKKLQEDPSLPEDVRHVLMEHINKAKVEELLTNAAINEKPPFSLFCS